MTGADLKTGSLPDCPAGMKLAAGTCIETKAREKSALGFAVVTCASEGLRLATQGELAAFDLEGTAQNSPREWIEPVYFAGDGAERGNFIALLSGSLVLGTESAGAEYNYRCAVSPTY